MFRQGAVLADEDESLTNRRPDEHAIKGILVPGEEGQAMERGGCRGVELQNMPPARVTKPGRSSVAAPSIRSFRASILN